MKKSEEQVEIQNIQLKGKTNTRKLDAGATAMLNKMRRLKSSFI